MATSFERTCYEKGARPHDQCPRARPDRRPPPHALQAVHATGRRKLILCALWTEICMAFTALDALREGYEVYPVTDAIGGTSPEAHRAGLDRVMQAGGQPIGWVSLAAELQRDWGRQETSGAVYEIVIGDRLAKEQ
jgi:hypothetical protein